MSRNKILIATEGISADFTGGAQTYIRDISNYLMEQNYDMYTITRKQKKDHLHYEVIDGNHIYRYSSVMRDNKLYKLYPLYSMINAKRKFEELIIDNKFDIINFHFPFPAIGILLSKYSKNIKKVYTFHAPTHEEILLDSSKKKLFPRMAINSLIPVIKRAERYALKHSDEIIVLSEFMKNRLLNAHPNINPNKINIVPGGVNIEYFRPVEDKNKLKSELGLNYKNINLFTARRLVARMGLKNLILAMKDIIKYYKNVNLYIAGKGYLMDELNNLIIQNKLQNNIKLLGFISDNELLSYYQVADYFILPTEKLEGFGLVTLESMSCGTPVIATPVGGSIEILDKFNKDFLFTSPSSEDIANKIIDILDKHTDSYNQELSEYSRKFVENNYSWSKVIKEIEDVFFRKI